MKVRHELKFKQKINGKFNHLINILTKKKMVINFSLYMKNTKLVKMVKPTYNKFHEVYITIF
jgi:hypothetical protein